MALLTIGAFARASQLTPKALRLYDELGLLPPAAVDPDSGYRLYRPEQLPHARLVAQLRRIGMPLEEIRTVCGLEPTAAAEAIAAYWQQVAADTAERGQLASFLVEHLSRRDLVMTNSHPTLEFRYATACETGDVQPATRTPYTPVSGCWQSPVEAADPAAPQPAPPPSKPSSQSSWSTHRQQTC